MITPDFISVIVSCFFEKINSQMTLCGFISDKTPKFKKLSVAITYNAQAH